MASVPIQELFYLLEGRGQKLQLAKEVNILLERISKESTKFNKYKESIKQLMVIKLLLRVTQIYKSLRIEKLGKLIPGVSITECERIIQGSNRSKITNIKIDLDKRALIINGEEKDHPKSTENKLVEVSKKLGYIIENIIWENPERVKEKRDTLINKAKDKLEDEEAEIEEEEKVGENMGTRQAKERKIGKEKVEDHISQQKKHLRETESSRQQKMDENIIERRVCKLIEKRDKLILSKKEEIRGSILSHNPSARIEKQKLDGIKLEEVKIDYLIELEGRETRKEESQGKNIAQKETHRIEYLCRAIREKENTKRVNQWNIMYEERKVDEEKRHNEKISEQIEMVNLLTEINTAKENIMKKIISSKEDIYVEEMNEYKELHKLRLREIIIERANKLLIQRKEEEIREKLQAEERDKVKSELGEEGGIGWGRGVKVVKVGAGWGEDMDIEDPRGEDVDVEEEGVDVVKGWGSKGGEKDKEDRWGGARGAGSRHTGDMDSPVQEVGWRKGGKVQEMTQKLQRDAEERKVQEPGEEHKRDRQRTDRVGEEHMKESSRGFEAPRGFDAPPKPISHPPEAGAMSRSGFGKAIGTPTDKPQDSLPTHSPQGRWQGGGGGFRDREGEGRGGRGGRDQPRKRPTQEEGSIRFPVYS